MLRKINDFISRIEERVLGFSIILMALILIANVIARKLNNSLSFAEEVGATLLTICTFLGIGYAAKKARHIRMSAFFDIFPPRVQKVVVIFTSVITMLLLFYLSYISIGYTRYIKMLGKVTVALRLPAWWVTVPLSVGFFLGGVQYFLNIFINLRNPEIYIGTEKIVDDVSTDTVFDLIETGGEQNEQGKKTE